MKLCGQDTRSKKGDLFTSAEFNILYHFIKYNKKQWHHISHAYSIRMRRSVEDYLIRVEVCKRLHPTEGSIHAQRSNNTRTTASSPLHSGGGGGGRENVSSSSNKNSGAILAGRKVSRSVSTPRSSTRSVMDLLSPNYRWVACFDYFTVIIWIV